MKVPQLEPFIGKEEYEAVKSVIENKWITEGPVSKEFSEKLLKLIGAKYGVFAPNGTLAIYLALRAIGVGRGDEVIVPDFTFIASATAVEMCGATPVFIDVNKKNFQIDLSHADKVVTKKTKAIMPVHIYGTVCNMYDLIKFAKKHKLKIVEDAAQAIDVHYKDKHAGTFGEVGCFSFFTDKTITTAEGGFIVTNDEKIYENLLYLRNQGRIDRGSFIHPRLGYNFRMTDIQNAIGLAQLTKLEEIKRRKKHIHELYMKNLSEVKGLTFFQPEIGADWIPFRMLILCDDADDLMTFMKSKEIEPRTFFYPLHKQPAFNYLGNKDSDFPNAIYGYEHGVCLPIFPDLKDDQIKYVCDTIKEFMSRDVFYKYYDDMFHKKNYKSETDTIFRLSDEFGIAAPKKILEIGCGTGNHTLELSRASDTEITAIDIDPKMIEIAKKKLKHRKNVTVLEIKVEDLKENKFDLILAMFNVINYISSTSNLESFFNSVFLHLNSGGVFVFDSWNGVAAIKDPPTGKTTKFKKNGRTGRVILKSETNYLKGISTLIYNFEINKGKEKETGTYSLEHTLWTPREIFSVIKNAGFEVAKFSDGWKMHFCVRKPK